VFVCAGEIAASIFQETELNHADHTGHPAASVSQNPDLYAQKHFSDKQGPLIRHSRRGPMLDWLQR